ncbi:hypothetical protein HGRIS_008489 [Hohenbuehelia grisea]|uniref:Uncharacterized protein n=1 Tax=Hohenbuehelia grisea TaxID=104357 RepID=A0ABR3J8L1_9AGAR
MLIVNPPVHILSGDLILHKRTIDPIKTVVYGLRRYDLDRCAALADMRASVQPRPGGQGTGGPGAPGEYHRSASAESSSSGESQHTDYSHGMGNTYGANALVGGMGGMGAPGPGPGSGSQGWGDGRRQVEGFMSYKAKIYLADVYDHMDFVLTSLDMFSGVTENLINYAFNMASYEMNETMRRLTLATIIFLPLTLLTGYFGMNFEHMWSIQDKSDVLFWMIALPVMGVLIPIFLFNDIARMAHYLQKRLAGERLAKQRL